MAPLLNGNNALDNFTKSSSKAGVRAPNAWEVRIGTVMIISVAIIVYHVVFNNYFIYDDFIWLNRARTLTQNWLQIFRPDVTYFDPLVHLMFWFDFLVSGLDPRWYHGVDLLIHTANALLTYHFARLLSNDNRVAIYAGILFACSCSIADAVLWSSSRVDLVATLFSLGALIQFLDYLRSERRICLLLSLLLFVLALGAKGTPLVLPIIFLWLIIQEKKPIRNVIKLAPFGAVVLIYIFLLKLTMHQASLPLDRLHFNIQNLVLAFCELFTPEITLSHLDLKVYAPILFIVVSAIGVLGKTTLLRRTGYCSLMASIMPVLVITDFKLVNEYSDIALLLNSPSHRIYLAAVGYALLGAGFIRSTETYFSSHFPRVTTAAVYIFLTGIVIGNALLVRERNSIWEFAGNLSQNSVTGLLRYRQQIGEGSQVGLVNFPGSTGFTTPMLRVCLGLNEVTSMRQVYTGVTTDLDVLKKAEKSFLFILGRDEQVYDKTQQYREQLLTSREIIQNPFNHSPGLVTVCEARGAQLVVPEIL